MFPAPSPPPPIIKILSTHEQIKPLKNGQTVKIPLSQVEVRAGAGVGNVRWALYPATLVMTATRRKQLAALGALDGSPLPASCNSHKLVAVVIIPLWLEKTKK